MQTETEDWERYGRALVGAMADVLGEADEAVRPLLLETADYWFSLGLAIGTQEPHHAGRLLQIVEAHEGNRAELAEDGAAFCDEALG
jgi:hypothetical protein